MVMLIFGTVYFYKAVFISMIYFLSALGTRHRSPDLGLQEWDEDHPLVVDLTGT